MGQQPGTETDPQEPDFEGGVAQEAMPDGDETIEDEEEGEDEEGADAVPEA